MQQRQTVYANDVVKALSRLAIQTDYDDVIAVEIASVIRVRRVDDDDDDCVE